MTWILDPIVRLLGFYLLGLELPLLDFLCHMIGSFHYKEENPQKHSLVRLSSPLLLEYITETPFKT